MNPSTVLGMFGGIVMLSAIIAVSAKDLGFYWNVPGIGIVLGGTIAATLISYPLHEVLRVFRIFIIVLQSERYYAKEDMEEIVEVSRQWFKGNLPAIESRLNELKNPFLRMGIQLVIDDTPLDDILDLLQWRMNRLHAKEAAEAQVFRTMAMFAPAFGMLGTLIGLINMLFSMGGNDFARIGANLGIALITTFVSPLEAPAAALAEAYHQRWEHETGNDQLKTHLRGPGKVLRSRSPDMARQEIYGYLLAHWAISGLICQAATEADIDPDRVKFTRTVRIIRRAIAPAAFPP